MECDECGRELLPDARFCVSCGAPVTEGVVAGSGNAERRGGDADPTRRIERPGEADPTTRVEDTDPGLEAVGPAGEGLAACPRCGATNSVRRLLCASCGADLETGEPGGRESATTELGAPAAAEPDAGVRRTVVMVVAGAVVLGIVLGVGLLATGVIGGSDSELPRPPTFTGSVERLAVEQVVASSAVSDGADPGLVADGDLTTAWHTEEGATVGEVIELHLDGQAWIDELQFAVGDQGPGTDFGSLARPVRIRVRFGDDDSVIVELSDEPGVQSVRLDPPRRTERVRVEVLEVAPASGQESVALSEIVARGHLADSAEGEAGGPVG